MITRWSAAELASRLRSREVSALEVADSYLRRIEELDGSTHAYLRVDPDGARRDARAAQALLDQGTGGALAGVPIALKDNLSTAGLETTCASRILEGYVPPFDATVVARCRGAGMAVLGKTNLDEFAMGTSTESSAFGPTRNPWDPERSPGGSSGGSAAAVAAEFAPVALGSDTGGSIRQPAAVCGVVGFKPTYGRVSRYGLVAFGSSLDQIGPLARTVEDAALVAEVISGTCPLDATSRPAPPINSGRVREGSLRGLRVGIPSELFGDAIQAGVLERVHEAIAAMRREGAEVEEISLPSVRYAVTTYYIIAPAEASSNLARFDGIRFGRTWEGEGHIARVERTRGEGFGREVKTRIMIGTYALSAGYYDAYYLRAHRVRAMMRAEFESAFRRCELLVSPTSPVTAFKLGELSLDPLALKLLDACTIPANMAGLPALSMNCGFDEGLPVGLQLIGAPMEDERVLQAAYCLERILPDAAKRPPIP